MPEQALSDVKVLDLTWHIAGPYCTKLLAGYGAEVVKVERPGEGDPARRMGPFFKDDPHPEKSGLFLHLNTNKKGITLNLKSATGKKILKALVSDADILVESFSPRVMPSLGLDYQTLEQINPKLVMVSISNFGQSGPYRDFRASEIVEYAMGGEMYSTGIADREPLKLGGNVTQYQAGTVAAVATMGALYGAECQEVGQHVDVSIMETKAGSADRRIIYLLGNACAGVLTTRWPPPREAVRMMILPQGVYPCKDGFINTLSLPQWWPRYLEAMGMPELKDDPRFQNIFSAEAGMEFDAIWYSWLADHTREELFETFREARIASAPVNSPEDLLEYAHLKERQYFTEIDHPETGKVTYPGAPFKMTETPCQARHPAPLLGQHNEEIYCKLLGYPREDLVKLRESGVI
ncbi:MAG: CoA transferase [Dehalococcoidia bacterium]|nr:MAG: CoA transferase [Dehalococcoidia bacterium]